MTHPDDIFAQLFPPALPPLSEDMKRRASALMLMREAVAAPEFARALLLTQYSSHGCMAIDTAIDHLARVFGVLDRLAGDLAKEAEAQAPKPEPVSALDAMASEYARKKAPHA